ncbi:MAG: roadblock/LC7 domain-containing protein [Methanomicrobiales archaeon]|jgi:hypothetical protein|nr:roadblock/LC7 domain-containing protein [Methanomicrobiales archaeon]
MLNERIQAYIERISTLPYVRECAIVSRDGVMLGRSGGRTFNESWFAMMSAALHSAATSVAGIIYASEPVFVTVQTGEGTLILSTIGEQALIVIDAGNTSVSCETWNNIASVMRECAEVI